MPDSIYVVENSQQVGPLAYSTVQEMVKGGRVGPTTLCWYDGLKDWSPAGTVLPDLFSVAPPAPPTAIPTPVAPPPRVPTTRFELQNENGCFLPRLTLTDDTVHIPTEHLSYCVGKVEMTVSDVRPRLVTLSGMGEVFLNAVTGVCHLMDLRDEAWAVMPHSLMAADATVEPIWELANGTGVDRWRLTGSGKVLIGVQGVVRELVLQGQSIVVRAAIVGAFSANLQCVPTTLGGEGTVAPPFLEISGQGKVLIAPVPNR